MRLPAKPGSPGPLGELLVHDRPEPCDAGRDDREELVVRAGEVELQLAVLIDRADGGDGLRAFAVLAQAFGPELHPPAGEALEPVGIGHRHRDVLALERRGDRERRAERGRNVGRGRAAADRGVGFIRAPADGVDVEAEHGGRATGPHW